MGDCFCTSFIFNMLQASLASMLLKLKLLCICFSRIVYCCLGKTVYGARFRKYIATFLCTKYFFDAASSCFCRHEIYFCATSTFFFVDMKYFFVNINTFLSKPKLLLVQCQTFYSNTKLLFVQHQIFVFGIIYVMSW